MSGEKGRRPGQTVAHGGLVGGLYDFIVGTFGWWNENFTSRICGWGETIADKFKLVFKINTGAAVLGLGYIVGLKYAAIICAAHWPYGGLSYRHFLVLGRPSAECLESGHHDSRKRYVTRTYLQGICQEHRYRRYCHGGIIGIVRSWGIIKSAVSLAASEMKGKRPKRT